MSVLTLCRYCLKVSESSSVFFPVAKPTTSCFSTYKTFGNNLFEFVAIGKSFGHKRSLSDSGNSDDSGDQTPQTHQTSNRPDVDEGLSRNSFVERVDTSTYNWREHLNVRDQKFVDHVICNVRGGTSGAGLEKFGGVGGDGGDVFLLADAKLTMSEIQPKKPAKVLKLRGEDGFPSTKRQIKGERGRDLVFKVPVGTSVCDVRGKQLMDLNEVGDMIQVAKGGSGGRSQNEFKSEKGSFGTLKLFLKLIADIGLVGFPNAGKSTLLSQISEAKPSITPFPFTTLHPNVGNIKYNDLRAISVADTPGLIEGAHENIGLGHRFLRHIERTKVLAYVTDVHGFQLNQTSIQRCGYETLLLLIKELELYDPSLLYKPSVLLLNKVEDDSSQKLANQIIDSYRNKEIPSSVQQYAPFQFPHFGSILTISAKERFGLEKVAEVFREQLDKVAFEDEVIAGGQFLTPEQRKERLVFEMTHKIESD